ncbi:MAG TPA: hypothetical protein PLW86_15885, partial [Rhodocyclaceae bacterium]|nr:hypothetical protein [Rhodocyclaceae bacterium]
MGTVTGAAATLGVVDTTAAVGVGAAGAAGGGAATAAVVTGVVGLAPGLPEGVIRSRISAS